MDFLHFESCKTYFAATIASYFLVSYSYLIQKLGLYFSFPTF